MRRAGLSLALAAALVGCGGVDDGLGLAVSGLAAEAVTVLVDAHPADRPCLEIRDSGPGIRGTYVAELGVEAGAASQTTELSAMRPGTYTLALWALDESGAPIAYGCADEVVIRDGKKTRVAVTLVPYSD
ncbi:hypothetical protein L6R52_26345 [Myxococcota bacterium]|nr:hypothetical protein [Myxococcota bacterium]